MRDRCAALRYLALGYRALLRTTRRDLLVEEADETDERTQRVQPSGAHLSFGGVSHGRSSGKVVGGGEEGKGTLHIDAYRTDCIVESTFGNFVQVVLSQQWCVTPNLTGKRRYRYTLCVVRTPYVRTPNAPRPTPTRP